MHKFEIPKELEDLLSNTETQASLVDTAILVLGAKAAHALDTFETNVEKIVAVLNRYPHAKYDPATFEKAHEFHTAAALKFMEAVKR